MEIPFTRFTGRLKQLHVTQLSSIFDVFFPRFRTEGPVSSTITRGRARLFAGEYAWGGDSAAFVGRGRERRFAGDDSLPRERYYCLEDSASNEPANNTLLGELFAYAEPRFPLQPELLDSTVDTELTAKLWPELTIPSILHIAPPRNSAWLLPPVLGIPPSGCVLQYPMKIAEVSIDRAIDLRLPETLQWVFDTFVALEKEGEGEFEPVAGNKFHVSKTDPPQSPSDFLPTLLSQGLGGGSPFLQGIGAWLRAHGAEALIYPSARSDSLTVVRDGVVQESYGYILVDYRDAPPCDFNLQQYFGALPAWRERVTKPIVVTTTQDGGESRLQITGVQALQQHRFAVFHAWAVNTFEHARAQLQDKEKTLADRVQLSLTRPSTLLGDDALATLGSDQEFIAAEGGPATGFLVEWLSGPSSSVAGFLGSVLPAAGSEHWEDQWTWDGTNWFLHRLCTRRPWAVLKCPVCLVESFWNISAGCPTAACVHCGFDNSGSGTVDFDQYRKWGGELAESEGRDGASPDRARESAAIYAAVCHLGEDAVTAARPAGEQSPPPPGVSSEQGASGSDVGAEMPEAFVRSVVGCVFAVMNDPSVRSAIDAVHPASSDALQRYAELLALAIPSLPPLAPENVATILHELQRSVTTESGPVDVPAIEILQYLSRAFANAKAPDDVERQ